mgnify:CR=1 FL=1
MRSFTDILGETSLERKCRFLFGLCLFVLIAGSIFFGQDFAVGHGEHYTSNFHLIAGIVVFLVALAGLKLAEFLLNRFCGYERPLPLMRSSEGIQPSPRMNKG